VCQREEISRGLALGLSCRTIAKGIGRSPSTVSRKVARNQGRSRYRCGDAEAVAFARARRPKVAKLAGCARLQAEVTKRLLLRWSPQQISGWLPRAFPHDLEMRVSHETIYMSLFVQARGALAKELTRHLRSGRALRRPRTQPGHQGQGHLRDMVLIRERPAEVDDRAIPGHWEGDLIMGKRPSSIATLVERTSRYVMLVALHEGYAAESVRVALAKSVTTLPEQLRRSLTWDRGREMAEHVRFSVDTGVAVYFCDPRSPWQRGSNENTNGLLRQYFPKSSNLATATQADLDAVAAELNGRPRQTLNWMSPSEKLAEVMR
jgi:IS30 family transposase